MVKLTQAASRRRQSTHRYEMEKMRHMMPSRAGNDCTPQATMVKLMQLGGGVQGTSCPLQNAAIRALATE